VEARVTACRTMCHSATRSNVTNAKAACETCHGEFADRDVMRKEKETSMGSAWTVIRQPALLRRAISVTSKDSEPSDRKDTLSQVRP